MIELTTLDPVEKTRTYHLHGGETFVLENVCKLAVSERGTHRLETTDGLKHIVPADCWYAITLDVDSWSL